MNFTNKDKKIRKNTIFYFNLSEKFRKIEIYSSKLIFSDKKIVSLTLLY